MSNDVKMTRGYNISVLKVRGFEVGMVPPFKTVTLIPRLQKVKSLCLTKYYDFKTYPLLN